ncbi:hypothetical protein IFM89_011410 [Coptis chinensis]|uniref:Uncharacterized protein n=1 Tax=Coptis chinensis TaxID=261450 RepID=A0A835HMF6_9MAGN|nr:hypothetical protein IFM89_011410 [Coptis chinensis]
MLLLLQCMWEPEGQPGDENQGENENRPVENDNQVDPAEQNGFNWRVIVKEIQTIVVGFITSLLPGFHNVD